MIDAMKQALAKFEHLWEIGIDAEYKVELLQEIKALRQAIAEAEKQYGWVLREVYFEGGEPLAHREPQEATLQEISDTEQRINRYCESKKFEALESLVLQWSKDRKIIPNATPVAQLLKAVSEMGELADAENKGNEAEIRDAVGDVLVCLINYCALRKLSLVGCLEGSYNEIKDRKGTLLANGVFVKE